MGVISFPVKIEAQDRVRSQTQFEDTNVPTHPLPETANLHQTPLQDRPCIGIVLAGELQIGN